MLRNFEFVSGATFCFLFGGDDTALRFHGVRQLVEADQGESVAVKVTEAGNDSAPDRRFFAEEHAGSVDGGELRVWSYASSSGALGGLRLIANALQARRSLEADAALGPFLELCSDIFGDEHNLRGTPDKFVLLRVRLRSDQRKDGCAIRRRYTDPAIAGLHPRVEGDVEAELVNEKTETAILVADEDIDAVKAQVRGLALR